MAERRRFERNFGIRSGATRVPRERILIVCEGAKTEPLYFGELCREWRVSTLDVEIVAGGEICGSAPISLVDHAITRKEKREKEAKRGIVVEYDEVWCVFDREGTHQNLSLPQALDKAKANKIEIALSAPCFEYWLLLHFEYTARPFDKCDKVIARLRKWLPGYDKGSIQFRELSSRLDAALANARHLAQDTVVQSPSTRVHEPVEKLKAMVSPWNLGGTPRATTP